MQRRCVSVCMQMHESCIQAGIAGEKVGRLAERVAGQGPRVSGSQGLFLSLVCGFPPISAGAAEPRPR